MATPTQEVQNRALSLVRDTYSDYKRLNMDYNERMLRIYEAFSTYEEPRTSDWQTTFKVNKAHEVVEKILPRIIAKNPRWVVTPRIDDFEPDKSYLLRGETPEEMAQRQIEYQARLKRANDFSRGIQDYLTYIFDEYNLEKPIRIWAKNMLIYGKGRARIRYKYEVATLLEDDGEEESEVEEVGEDGEVVVKTEKKRKKRRVEKVAGEYPTVEVKSWTDVYTDPRYQSVADMPAYIEIMNGVRLAELKRNKDKYINLDKLENIAELSSYATTDESYYKRRVQAIAGIQNMTINTVVDKNSMQLKIFYGYFQKSDDAEEQMYKICTVEDMLVIQMEEISQIPFEEIDCFEDPETNHSVGFVEPILGLQREMNFKKNSASTYINNALNRSWIWSSNSGIDPRDLISKPNNIIVTTKTVPEALNNLTELPHRELNSSYFQEGNDFERQIQSMTFTVDTSNPQNQQALTNTATGIRVKFFESNSVIDEIRKHFEKGLERLAYKLLQATFENMEDNIVIKKIGDEGFWEINKELLRDAITRYSIKIEVNSSSFSDIESRREDAIGFFNSAQLAKQAGVDIDLAEVWKDVAYTFEKKDISRYIKSKSMAEIAQQLMGAPPGPPPGAGGGGPMPPPPEAGLPPPAALTEQVAGGGLTSAIPA